MPIKPAAEAVFVGVVVCLAWGSGSRAVTPDDLPAPQQPGAEAARAEMAGIMVRGRFELDDAVIAGLPPGSHPHVITLQDAYKLALLRATAAPAPIRDAKDLQARLQKPLLDFAQFRRVFLEAPPAAAGDAGKAFRDPAPGFLKILVQLQTIETQGSALRGSEALANVLTELVKSEASGVTSDNVERFQLVILRAKLQQQVRTTHYRSALDELKVQLGLPVDLPIVLDRTPLAAFREIDFAIDRWTPDPRRTRAGLDALMKTLPALDDLTVAGRPLLGTLQSHPEQLGSLLATAAQTAAQNRPIPQGAARSARLDDRTALALRNQVRQLVLTAELYQTAQMALATETWSYDDAVERLLLPPAASPEPNGQPASKAVQQTLKLLAADQAVAAAEDELVETWTRYTLGRLALFRATGTLPYDDWPTYLKSLTASVSKSKSNAK